MLPELVLAANTFTLRGIPTLSTHHLGIQFSFRYFLDCIVLLILQIKKVIIAFSLKFQSNSLNLRLDSNIESKSSNNTYLNINYQL